MINMGELFAYDIIGEMPMERVKMSEREKEKFLVSPGDLLFARQSLVASGAGKCSIVKSISEPTTFESHLIRVRLDPNKADPWYFYYYFRLPNTPVKAIVNQCAQAGIRGSELAKIKICNPDILLQHKIASLLSVYDNRIEVNNKSIDLIEKMVECIYKHLCSKKHDGRRVVRLGDDVIRLIRGLSYSSEEIDCDDGIDLINLKNIKGYGGFRFDGTKQYNGKYKQEQIVNQGDLVMGVTDMTQDRRTVGSVALMPSLKRVSVISADLVKIESPYDNIFLYAMFRFGNVSRYVAQFANGANVLHLKPQSILKVKVDLPDEKTIEKFVKIAKPMISIINNLNDQNSILERERDLLLPRLMSGRMKP